MRFVQLHDGVVVKRHDAFCPVVAFGGRLDQEGVMHIDGRGLKVIGGLHDENQFRNGEDGSVAGTRQAFFSPPPDLSDVIFIVCSSNPRING